MRKEAMEGVDQQTVTAVVALMLVSSDGVGGVGREQERAGQLKGEGHRVTSLRPIDRHQGVSAPSQTTSTPSRPSSAAVGGVVLAEVERTKGRAQSPRPGQMRALEVRLTESSQWTVALHCPMQRHDSDSELCRMHGVESSGGIERKDLLSSQPAILQPSSQRSTSLSLDNAHLLHQQLQR